MSMIAQFDFQGSLEPVFTNVVNFIPRFLAFLVILIVGYFVAKLIAKAINSVLERVGFDRAVERGGVKKALANTKYDASDILAKIAFYAVFLFVLQMAFGVFGPNPISELLYGVIAFLPNVFIAVIIVVVAAAIASAVREIVAASLGGLSYGRTLATVASVAILAVGVFAALNQLQVAEQIVNGIFYALLAIIAGSAIIAIGGGGVRPMQRKWEESLQRYDEEKHHVRRELRAGQTDGAGRADGAGPTAPRDPRVTDGPETDRTVTLPEGAHRA